MLVILSSKVSLSGKHVYFMFDYQLMNSQMDRLKIGRRRIYDAMCLFFTPARKSAPLTGDTKSETPESQS